MVAARVGSWCGAALRRTLCHVCTHADGGRASVRAPRARCPPCIDIDCHPPRTINAKSVSNALYIDLRQQLFLGVATCQPTVAMSTSRGPLAGSPAIPLAAWSASGQRRPCTSHPQLPLVTDDVLALTAVGALCISAQCSAARSTIRWRCSQWRECGTVFCELCVRSFASGSRCDRATVERNRVASHRVHVLCGLALPAARSDADRERHCVWSSASAYWLYVPSLLHAAALVDDSAFAGTPTDDARRNRDDALEHLAAALDTEAARVAAVTAASFGLAGPATGGAALDAGVAATRLRDAFEHHMERALRERMGAVVRVDMALLVAQHPGLVVVAETPRLRALTRLIDDVIVSARVRALSVAANANARDKLGPAVSADEARRYVAAVFEANGIRADGGDDPDAATSATSATASTSSAATTVARARMPTSFGTTFTLGGTSSSSSAAALLGGDVGRLRLSWTIGRPVGDSTLPAATTSTIASAVASADAAGADVVDARVFSVATQKQTLDRTLSDTSLLQRLATACAGADNACSWPLVCDVLLLDRLLYGPVRFSSSGGGNGDDGDEHGAAELALYVDDCPCPHGIGVEHLCEILGAAYARAARLIVKRVDGGGVDGDAVPSSPDTALSADDAAAVIAHARRVATGPYAIALRAYLHTRRVALPLSSPVDRRRPSSVSSGGPPRKRAAIATAAGGASGAAADSEHPGSARTSTPTVHYVAAYMQQYYTITNGGSRERTTTPADVFAHFGAHRPQPVPDDVVDIANTAQFGRYVRRARACLQ